MLIKRINEYNFHRKKNKAETHFNQFPWIRFNIDRSGHQSISHIYSTPNIQLLQLSLLEKKLGVPFWHFHTNYISGIYFELNESSFLVFEPKELELSKKNLLLDKINQSIDSSLSIELKEFAKDEGLQRLESLNGFTFGAIINAYHQALALFFGISEAEILNKKIINTHRDLVRNYHAAMNSKVLESESHVDNFSIIYFIELKAIEYLLKDQANLSIHDAATNTGHFPSLIDSLNSNTLTRTIIDKIYCSDIFPELATNTINILCNTGQINPDNISLLTIDLINEYLGTAAWDIITVNDVLEHFDDKTSKTILSKLWNATKRLLIVHVPFEESPHIEYGHLTTFNKNKLFLWAEQLDQCKNVTYEISNHMSNTYNISNLDQYLFLLKE